MFWKFNHPSSPHIETLLNKDDVTLQELMEEDDIIQECKVQNKKLIDYLIRADVMEELVMLTTLEPPEDVEERLRYKYPNIACELMTCDVPAINERLARDEALLGKLYAFLDSDKPLNPLLASFFSKTIGVLVARRSEQVLEFLKSKENFGQLLLKHLGTSAIMDLIFKLVTQVEGTDMRQNILNWLNSQHVVQALVGLLDPSVDSERQSNAAHLLCDIIQNCRENQNTSSERSEPDIILTTIESPETVTLLLDHILSGTEKSETSIVGGISVLLALLDFSKPNMPSSDMNIYGGNSSGSGQSDDTSGENEHPAQVVLHTTMAILPRLKDFHQLLLDPPRKAAVRTTACVLDPPLGNTRLQVARLLSVLVATNNAEINKELINLGTVDVLLDLFFKYSWNNFLHCQVEQFLAFALNAEVRPGTGDVFPDSHLLQHILVKCRLLQRILDAWDDNESQSSCQGRRRGYMGHLIKIANHILNASEKGTLSSFITENVSPDVVDAWEAFVLNQLAEINKSNQLCLGGVHPALSSSEDGNKEFSNVPFHQGAEVQQEIFTEFQMQNVPPQFENFSFSDQEEFTEGEEALYMTFSVTATDSLSPQGGQSSTCKEKHQQNEDDVWEQDVDFRAIAASRNSQWGESGTNSSSDEDERGEPDGREEDHMDVDIIDQWPAPSEAAVAPVAVDASNPWGRNDPLVASAPVLPEQASWANFDSAGFADFEANFTASGSTDLRDGETAESIDETPSVPKIDNSSCNSMLAITSADDSPDKAPAGRALPSQEPHTSDKEEITPQQLPESGSDDNANPRAETASSEQLMDNYRFLSGQGMIADSNTGSGDQAEGPPLPEPSPQENGPVLESPILDGSTDVPAKSKSAEGSSPPTSIATTTTTTTTIPNGPV
uniref:Serine/threonine-protein phosphatase 6 regulatory subunit 3 n=3 Tax=Timema TaxID=61471 RepID=A0A7R9EUU9_9NEOP|nr:unnamed protein product [Timema bartmani]